MCPRMSPRFRIRVACAALIFLFSASTGADEAPPHRFLVIGASMSDNMAGSDFESFWISLALDFPILSDIGIGEFKPMKAFALPAVIIKSNDSPGELITDVFGEGLTQSGETVEVEFTKISTIDSDSSDHYDWIRKNLLFPNEIPEDQAFESRYDIIFALDLFYKDFKFIRDFDELEPGTDQQRDLDRTKERITEILARSSYHAREIIVGSPLIGYENFERSPETGRLYPTIEGPRQGHEWMDQLVLNRVNSPQMLPREATGRIEIFDLRTIFSVLHQNDGIVFDLLGSRYQASRREVLAADNRHASVNGSKIIANILMEGIYERNPDWRPYMNQIPFVAVRLGASKAMGPLNQDQYSKEAEATAARAKELSINHDRRPEP